MIPKLLRFFFIGWIAFLLVNAFPYFAYIELYNAHEHSSFYSFVLSPSFYFVALPLFCLFGACWLAIPSSFLLYALKRKRLVEFVVAAPVMVFLINLILIFLITPRPALQYELGVGIDGLPAAVSFYFGSTVGGAGAWYLFVCEDVKKAQAIFLSSTVAIFVAIGFFATPKTVATVLCNQHGGELVTHFESGGDNPFLVMPGSVVYSCRIVSKHSGRCLETVMDRLPPRRGRLACVAE